MRFTGSPPGLGGLGAVAWTAGTWTREPVDAAIDGTALLVTAATGSDAWRTTAYGFSRDTAHALLVPFAQESAVEVTFAADCREQFDQAGIFIREDEATWIKAGLEFADGALQAGAVVTHERSDWSSGRFWGEEAETVTVRASRSGDAITIRMRVADGLFRLVRVAPMDPEAVLTAGPYLCAPSRSGFTVRFHRWEIATPDEYLHET
jgi:regulation of enolase protein 1 (concanavalin A-like superfamily)